MKLLNLRFNLLILITAFSVNASAEDATTELFHLLSEGECKPAVLANDVWTIDTSPVGTHDELLSGDQLMFEQLNPTSSLSHKSEFNVWKNGQLWVSTNGWSGSCVRDGNQSLYVVTGEIEVDGCIHELAIGRLDHDDVLSGRIEIVFQDSRSKNQEQCQDYNILHPGHAHGTND